MFGGAGSGGNAPGVVVSGRVAEVKRCFKINGLEMAKDVQHPIA